MRSSQWYWPFALVSMVLILNGCRKASAPESDKPTNVRAEPRIQKGDDLPSVVFDLKPFTSAGEDGFLIYECTYQARGKVARFRFQFKQGRRTPGQFPVSGGEGKFLAVPGSDNSVLLLDLKKALEAKRVPAHSSRISELPFDAVVLGEHQSRSADGGFSATPAGDWTAIKIFLPKGRDDGEVFLNFNPVLGKGEFSLKDSDYGDYLLKEFAKVM